jgi:hypothetical protein
MDTQCDMCAILTLLIVLGVLMFTSKGVVRGCRYMLLNSCEVSPKKYQKNPLSLDFRLSTRMALIRTCRFATPDPRPRVLMEYRAM